MRRRDFLKSSICVAAVGQAAEREVRSQNRKRIVVIGAGIAGLCCGYELMKQGHEVTVLEASGRTGGHVRTVRDSLADGLYADGGAEHLTRPGYEILWRYVDEFDLEACRCLQRDDMRRVIDGKWYDEAKLKDASVLRQLGFNQRERRFLQENDWTDLPMLYFQPYLANFEDEYDPFSSGLERLDELSMGEFMLREGGSEGALKRLGGEASALHVLWHAAILRLRGVPLFPKQVFRMTGGNQKICDAFARKLGERVFLGCPVTEIKQEGSAVRVRYNAFGREEQTLEADYAVSCVNLNELAKISLSPQLPPRKQTAIELLNYYSHTRVVFQSRSKFWEKDGVSPNMSIGDPALSGVWQMAAEVPTSRGLLEGTAPGLAGAESVLAAFRSIYPGRSEDIEQVYVLRWPEEKWCSSCETVSCRPGQLAKIWPAIIEPWRRLYFAGAYADNLNWGMEAATRSANRVARQVGQAS